jgi:hypothetical protein
MSTQTLIHVAFVNAPRPGDKKGSLKTKDGVYYGVWADQWSRIEGQVEEGGTYEIEYDESEFKGKTYRNIKTEKGIKTILAPGFAEAQAKSNGVYKYSTNPTDAERMFVCSILNAYVAAGKVMLNPTEIEHAVNMLRSVWGETFGRDE